MGLFTRFILFAAVVAVLAGVLLYTVAQGVLRDRFERLDRRRSEALLERLTVSLWHRLDTCDSLAVDWARWDDTYEFVVDQNQDFIDENLLPSVFEDQGIDFLALVDTEGKAIYCGRYDFTNASLHVGEAQWVAALRNSDHLWSFGGTEEAAIGCWNTPNGPMLIASRPILTSAATGPIRGAIMFGRSLDANELAVQGASVGLDLELSDVTPPPEAVLAEVDEETYRALLPVTSVSGGMAAVISADLPREVLHEGKGTLAVFAWLAVIMVVAVGGLTFVGLQLALARPVRRLMGAIVRLAAGDLTQRVPVAGHDELARLAEAVNAMAASIANGQAKLQQALAERDAALVRAGEELADSEQRYRVIFEHTGCATCIFHRDGSIHLANEVFAELFGYQRQEVEGVMSWRDVVLVEDHGETEAFIRSCFADPARSHQVKEIRHRRRDGSILWAAVTIATLPDDERAVASLIDVTSLRQSQQALLRNEQLAAVGTLADGVAHEFNNINASIQMGVQLVLQNEAISERARGLLQDVADAAHHGKRIAENLLGFAGSGTGVRRPQQLDEIVRRTAAIVSRTFSINGIALRCELAACPSSMLNETQIGQVLLNLLLNARDAVADVESARIEVHCGVAGAELFLEVSDNGSGIDAAIRERIFDPFFSTKSVDGAGVCGTGLGLSIVYSIVRAHGGDIAVSDAAIGGTCFRVTLPVYQRNADDETARILKRALDS